MKRLERLLLFLSCAFMCNLSCGFSDINHTLHAYVRNNTRYNFQFIGVLESNPGNYFTAQPSVIHPGETMHITAEKFLNTDVAANLFFKTSEGNEAYFLILDQEQIHMGQGIFDFQGANIDSWIISKKRNENAGPRYLTYREVVLEILNKI